MASAQVLPHSVGSSRKQEHLEAGKRRLEEFRKKKAAARKAAPPSRSCSADSTAYEKQASETRQAHIDPAGDAGDAKSDVAKISGLFNHNDKSRGFILNDGSKSVPSPHATPQSHHMSFDLQQMDPKHEGNGRDILALEPKTSSVYSRQTDDQAGNVGFPGEGTYANGVPSSSSAEDNNIIFHGAGKSLSNKDIVSFQSFQNTNPAIYDVAASVHGEGRATNLLNDEHGADSLSSTVGLSPASKPGHGLHGGPEFKNNLASGLKERNSTNAATNLSTFYNRWPSESISAGSSSDVTGSFDGLLYSSVSETHPRRTRTSFIDSLNIIRGSPTPDWSYTEKEKLTTSKFHSDNFVASSAFQDSFTASALVASPSKQTFSPNVNNFDDRFRDHNFFDSLGSKLESSSQKQNEEFSALEQHIEDLTQERFSLQRALDTSKSLAESLAAENSSLSESYNQQASIVTQLKAEIERLQGEIKARLVELESVKAEYMNVHLECNAADERAKLLASEVIGLEEKALRLRSNELKLERELENSSAEIASYKKKLSSFEKERQDLLQSIHAFQEEKILFQSELQRYSASGISVDINQGYAKKDASTCTNDLGLDVSEAYRDSSIQASSDLQGHDNADNLLWLALHRPAGIEDSTIIPFDQLQMIQNISSLIAEIMAEKEELMHSLVIERSASTKLKDFNKELSQKLEVQTQRLELLTAQNMASENNVVQQPTGLHIARETVAYADEGDEVVERVLGWVLKLFPGGKSKRKTSRL